MLFTLLTSFAEGAEAWFEKKTSLIDMLTQLDEAKSEISVATGVSKDHIVSEKSTRRKDT